ncbi:hypothetical protein [Metabacillus malikii]|uniref:Uncharacterized protein n=1 Tax=Metabacillus malikii TaxID=1504265 RepID=A0ABT9ZHD6_9BACI|nr:hypothetical protein [Metabacillus malikii]MDQ0231700.1 hypothetical protein [Metabacillus malikii]
MNCLCETGQTNNLKLEGDVGADPVWCKECGCNLEVEDFDVSEALVKKLFEWSSSYGLWIDWETDTLRQNGLLLENKFNQIGKLLVNELAMELGDLYNITFIPSTSARFYATL